MNYEQARRTLEQFPRFEVKPGLARIRSLVAGLGDPQLAYPTVHVAGTNGKGSVVALLDAVLREAGYRVGRFTSPELMNFRDRIAVNGDWIAEDQFAVIVSDLAPLAELLEDVPSQFEVITAVAFEHLRRERIDLGLIEVGLGGRFDATNVVAPRVGVLTNVTLDHQALLGDTVEEIAWEKAGIAKRNTPLVIGRLPASVRDVVANACAAVGATLRQAEDFAARTVKLGWKGIELELRAQEHAWSVRVPLPSRTQMENVRLALSAIEALRVAGFVVPEEAVRCGLARVRWPGRMESIQDQPRVVVDGAHNLAAAHALAADVRELVPNAAHRFLLFGSLADKDVDGSLAALSEAFERIAVCAPQSARAMDVEELRPRAQALFKHVAYHEGVCTGVTATLSEMGPDDVLFVAGSLRMAAEAKACLEAKS